MLAGGGRSAFSHLIFHVYPRSEIVLFSLRFCLSSKKAKLPHPATIENFSQKDFQDSDHKHLNDLYDLHQMFYKIMYNYTYKA